MAVRVLILTLSGRDEAAVRELIRGSWGTRGSLARALRGGGESAFGHAFFVGNRTCLLPEAAQRYDIDCSLQDAGQPAREQSALLREARAHGDVVLLPAIDGYYRGLLSKYKLAFAWVVQHTQAQWVLKADTDLFARPLATARWASALDHTRMSVFGWLWGHEPIPAEPCRKCGKAGFQARHLHMLRGLGRMPPFPVGSAGYLLSRPVASFISEHGASFPPPHNCSLWQATLISDLILSKASRLESAGGDELPATDLSLGLWLSQSQRPVRLVNAPDAFSKEGDGLGCLHKPNALVCCHGSMGPRNMRRCGNSSWARDAPVTDEAELDALPRCQPRLPAPVRSRCHLVTGGGGRVQGHRTAGRKASGARGGAVGYGPSPERHAAARVRAGLQGAHKS
jgi:hypothetical protein